eukprot:TRINITY_DN835_c0_g1_i10.p2 TRINITY_DN835_c0_g1~~TRINITY_DN835_c0_g1_i10.p2  ORF type:complete len:104 (-),score=24.39 TRINITY_DN835_c0_g1_i10:370-645(-)
MCIRDRQRAVQFQEGQEFADSLGIKFIETSAKNSNNVEKAFTTLAAEIKAKIAKNEETKPKKFSQTQTTGNKTIKTTDLNKPKDTRQGGCC